MTGLAWLVKPSVAAGVGYGFTTTIIARRENRASGLCRIRNALLRRWRRPPNVG